MLIYFINKNFSDSYLYKNTMNDQQVLDVQCYVICFFVLYLSTKTHHSQGIQSRPPRKAFNWSEFEDSIDDNLFHSIVRMDKASFHVLLKRIQPKLNDRYKYHFNLRFSFECMLHMTLSYLSGARISDLRVIYRPVSKMTIFRYIWSVIDAINQTFQFSFPVSAVELSKLECGFRAKSRNGVLKGCIGAIDGIHFPMKNPGKAIPNPNRYYVQRKNKFALLYIASCDAERKFTFFDCSKCSKSHHSMAFNGTKVSFILYFIFNYCFL